MVIQYNDSRGRGLFGLSMVTKNITLFFSIMFLGVYFFEFFRFYIDDTFIHFRYAMSFLEGHGFSYNVGEPPVLGTSSPLWSAFLMLPVMLNQPDPIPLVKVLSLLIAIVFLSLTLLCIVAVEKKINISNSSNSLVNANLAVLLFLACPVHWAWFFSGMEIPLYTLLYVIIVLIISKPPLVSPVRATLHGIGLVLMCFLAFLARPEGGATGIAALLTLALIKQRSSSVKNYGVFSFILTGCLLCACWLIFSYILFGSPIPTSVTIKRSALPISTLSLGGLLGNYLLTLLYLYRPVITCGVLLITAVAVLKPKALMQWAGTPIVLYNFLYMGIVLMTYLIANGHLMERYGAIFGPAILILLGQLVILFLSVITEKFCLSKRQQTMGTLVVTIGISLFGIFTFNNLPSYYKNLVDRYDNLKVLANKIEKISANSPSAEKEKWILVETLGILSYYTNLSVIDIAGLVSPEFTKVSHLLDGDVDHAGSRLDAQREVIYEQIITRHPKFIVLKPSQYRTYIEGLFREDQLQLRKIAHTPVDATGWEPFIAWEVEYH